MPLHVVSLGSSFAAGPSIAPRDGPRAVMRSARNYPHLLAEKLDAKLTDLTISGATLLTVGSESQTTGGTRFPPQIEGLSDDVDIVTITAGGNDLNYIGGLSIESIKAYKLGALWFGLYSWIFPKPDVSVLSEEQLTERYISVIDKIHDKSPKARIFIVEYLTILGSEAKPTIDIPIDAGRIEYHTQVADKLQRATAAAADARSGWCIRVPVAELSMEHGVGSATPWVQGFGLDLLVKGIAPYHPNAEGMEAVAKMIHERLVQPK